jgi:hypothetical protein
MKWSLTSQACCSLNEDTIDFLLISYVCWVLANIMTESSYCLLMSLEWVGQHHDHFLLLLLECNRNCKCLYNWFAEIWGGVLFSYPHLQLGADEAISSPTQKLSSPLSIKTLVQVIDAFHYTWAVGSYFLSFNVAINVMEGQFPISCCALMINFQASI